ncbi:MAG: hypothetical protein JKX81_04735 [Arenicella sp.]|nr:hypothetical protein [Arenicella sp.]
MNDKDIDDLLDQDIPEADTNARKIAINLAVSQFSQEINQGNIRAARPIDNEGTPSSKRSIWRQRMNFLKKPNSGQVFATVAVGFIAFALVSQIPDLEPNDSHKETFDPEALIDSRHPRVAGNSLLKADVKESDSDLLTKVKPAKRDEHVESEFGARSSFNSAPDLDEIATLEEIAVTSPSVENSIAAAPLRRAKREDKIGQQYSTVNDGIIQPIVEPIPTSSRKGLT